MASMAFIRLISCLGVVGVLSVRRWYCCDILVRRWRIGEHLRYLAYFFRAFALDILKIWGETIFVIT
jgi:hypothetical protein